MKKKIRIPDTYVIIFFVVVFAAILTYIIPVGSFTMEKIQYATEAGMKTRT
ncbi:MAG: putative basic amino acid antiporter YfcC, partial [Cetobacterium sp.]